MQGRIMRDEDNNFISNMKGLISFGKKMRLYPQNKEKPVSSFKKENDTIESLL